MAFVVIILQALVVAIWIAVLGRVLMSWIDPGAALTLFLAGPVSSLPAIIALAGMFQKRVLTVYLGVTLSVSILLGWLYQLMN